MSTGLYRLSEVLSSAQGTLSEPSRLASLLSSVPQHVTMDGEKRLGGRNWRDPS